jgi:hypothetical protein
MKKPTCKFLGKFPDGSQVSFTAQIPHGAVALLQGLCQRSFDTVMAEDFPNSSTRPELRRLTITINLPVLKK